VTHITWRLPDVKDTKDNLIISILQIIFRVRGYIRGGLRRDLHIIF